MILCVDELLSQNHVTSYEEMRPEWILEQLYKNIIISTPREAKIISCHMPLVYGPNKSLPMLQSIVAMSSGMIMLSVISLRRGCLIGKSLGRWSIKWSFPVLFCSVLSWVSSPWIGEKPKSLAILMYSRKKVRYFSTFWARPVSHWNVRIAEQNQSEWLTITEIQIPQSIFC